MLRHMVFYFIDNVKNIIKNHDFSLDDIFLTLKKFPPACPKFVVQMGICYLKHYGGQVKLLNSSVACGDLVKHSNFLTIF
ncbi:MAG TPA: hypothetical protein DCP53_05465 [Elusimicrobia bacterium]|nr:hypothetical protein [Elusimicrobiota bacterium]